MDKNVIPEFAIIGHPNEGKSCVVSTLAEDDTVRVSPIPGETVKCRVFPVVIDGKEIIRFTDTPGFQNPRQTLLWMENNYKGDDELLIKAFREAHENNLEFQDDCELFMPISKGAGIIYVVDGSRPVRKDDRAEMEILRITGHPRMAIINCKDDDNDYLDQWKNELRKNFNSIRVFNAHQATYMERIDLLESLTGMDQDWQPALKQVIAAFKKDWSHRNAVTSELMCALFEDCLQYYVSKTYDEESRTNLIKEKLQNRYKAKIRDIETRAHRKIRKLFKHNIFNFEMPEQSILNEDIFDEKTWHILGLTPTQLVTAAAFTGAAGGVGLDCLFGGISFGVFTVIGSVSSAAAALIGGKHMTDIEIKSPNILGFQMKSKVGKFQLKAGPNKNIQFLYVLIDRALIYYSHIINWAHGKRGLLESSNSRSISKKAEGFTHKWNEHQKKICNSFFKAIHNNDGILKEKSKKQLIEILKNALIEIYSKGKE